MFFVFENRNTVHHPLYNEFKPACVAEVFE